jgi:predicted TIM-barrel fold metal-dependent hydrolase
MSEVEALPVDAGVIARRPTPGDRRPQADDGFVLPVGTTVVSADNHFTLNEDIFYQRFPARLKDRAPRVWREDPIWHLGVDGKSYLPAEFYDNFRANDPVVGGFDLDVRVEELRREGVDKEIVFPNLVLGLHYYATPDIRSTCFRIYNEYLAELYDRAPGFFYGVGLVNQSEPENAAQAIAELKALGLKTYVLPLNPGKFPDGSDINYASPEMDGFWEAVAEADLPICFHIGESQSTIGRGAAGTRLMQNFAPFRKVVGELVFGGVLDRHPSLRVVFAEGGINWMLAALQDAEWIATSCVGLNWPLQHPLEHYWRSNFYASFMHDPLGLALIDRIGVDRAMWSIDYPHVEGIFGASRSSFRSVVEAAGEDGARRILGGNAIEVFGLG